MYSEVTLPDEFVEHLESLELGVPIRVLNGNASTFVPPPGWAGMARANHTTIDRCESEGLTIVSWGTDRAMPAPETLMYRGSIPGALYEDREPRPIGREWVNPSFGSSDPGSFTARDQTPPQEVVYARANTGGRTVWYHCQLGRAFAPPVEGMDLDRFLTAPIRRALDLDADERAAEEQAREEALREERRQAARGRFIESARRATTREAERHEAEERRARTAITSAEQTLIREWSAAREAARMAEVLRNNQEDEEALTRGFDALLGHPKVVSVEMPDDGSDGIWVFTTGLNIQPDYGGESRYLGQFRLTIPPPGGSVMMRNIDNPREGWAHPHCPQDAYPCWGGSEAIAAEMISNNELAGLFEFLIQYLETYNPQDSYGRHIRFWDEDMPRRTAGEPAEYADERDPDMYRVGGPVDPPPPATDIFGQPATTPGTPTPTPTPAGAPPGAELDDCDCDACQEARRR